MVRQPLPIPVGVTILTEPHRQARHGSARGPSPAEQEGRRTLAVVTPLAPALDARVGRLPTWRGGRCMEGEHAMGIHVRRDELVSVMYSTELNSTTSLVPPQRTDRHEILD